MLSRLTIKNLVVVKELELEFNSGMSVLTGETGAGKSILIDALGLSLGNKAETSLIRSGSEKAEVCAEFILDKIPFVLEWLKEHELDSDECCILRRVLIKNNRSRAFVNNNSVPQSVLRELGNLLIQINGQNTQQLFAKNSFQRELLDSFAGCEKQLERVKQSYKYLRDAEKQKSEIQNTNLDKENQLDYLEFQLKELEPVIENAVKIEEIESTYKKLSNGNNLKINASSVLDLINNKEPNLSSMLMHLSTMIGEMTKFDDSLLENQALIDTVKVQLDEVAKNIETYSEGLDDNPNKLHEMNNIISDLHHISRKHKIKISELPSLFESLNNKRSRLTNNNKLIEELDCKIDELKKDYEKKAESLTKERKKAAKNLSTQITNSIRELGMSKGLFQIALKTDQDSIRSHGKDQIDFLVSVNPGSELGSISKIASGGELSRIALALQVSISDCGTFPTIIFDEVDAGIGGAVAEIVGQLLRKLSRGYQVLCVTHLPQVASQAQNHLKVQKISTEDSSETKIEELYGDKRVKEIARMLGGVDITSKTVEHANEMIEQAQISG
tara:strand:- start:1107 stop:2780 length:1674 start_codon:yes stop_codon:yes gene_type:complete